MQLTLQMLILCVLDDDLHLYFPLATDYSKIRYFRVIMAFPTVV